MCNFVKGSLKRSLDAGKIDKEIFRSVCKKATDKITEGSLKVFPVTTVVTFLFCFDTRSALELGLSG